MHKLLILVFVFLTSSVIATAQTNTGRVSGSVQSSIEAVNGATVKVLKRNDSSLVKMSVCDKAGAFEIEKLAHGAYILKISAVGYSPFVSEPFVITADSSSVVIPPIELVKASRTLQSVSVLATRPLIENKIDRLVVNVEAAISNAGSTALEVLEKSPGVSVDRDGNLSLKGKQGVIVLIDGKQTYLSATDLATFLKTTPANQLDQIEIMSQPSAKYDASGNSGMINIKTKKSQQAGYNGSLSLSYTQGKYPKTNNSFVFNNRKGKVNLFTNIGISFNKNFFNIDLERKIIDKPTSAVTSFFSQASYNRRHEQPNSFKFGVDLFASKKTTFGAVASFTYLYASGGGESSNNIYNAAHTLTSINKAITDFMYDWHNYTVNLNYRYVIDTSGREITADVDYIRYHKTSPGINYNYTYDATSNPIALPYLLHTSMPSDIDIYTAKADYVHPIKRIAKIEAGIKSSYVNTDNIADYTYFDHPSASWKVDNRTNHFKYNENINAVYLNASRQVNKWGYQLGVRLENTIAQGTQVTNNESFRKNYTQLFPTAYVSYTPGKKNTFTLSFGRRIDRPSYQDMNPFRYFLDKFSYREGSPNLTPQFTHNIELSHNYKGQLNTSVNYTRTTDIITDVFNQNDTDSTLVYKRQNVATRRNIGLSINYNKAFNKIWTFTFFTNVYNMFYAGIINNAPLKTEYTTFQLNTSNQFKFNKGWSAEISALYRHRTLETSSINEPMGMIACGVGKQILNNQGTVRLNVRDPFYTMFYRGSTKFDNIDLKTRYQFDSRTIALAFTYRFGKNQNNVPQRKRTSASQEEQNRVGQTSN